MEPCWGLVQSREAQSSLGRSASGAWGSLAHPGAGKQNSQLGSSGMGGREAWGRPLGAWGLACFGEAFWKLWPKEVL